MRITSISTRRRVIVAVAASLVALAVPAQDTARAYRIGFLVPRSQANFEARTEAFRAGLRELGYVEGRNLTIEWRFADGDYERLPALVSELIRSKVDLLVVDSTPGVKAAQAATRSLPIVMIAVGDPVGSGFVASLSRPGGNITGLSNVVGDVSAKYVELLKLAVPNIRSIGVVINPDNSTHPRIAGQVRASASSIGLKVSQIPARTPAEIESAFTTIRKDGGGALIFLGDPFFGQQGRQIGELGLKNRVPTLLTNRALAEAGGLMSYGQDLAEHYRRAATYVHRILKGAGPGELPVEQSTKIELVINMKTATALGIKIPQPLLVRADDLIK